MGAHDFKMGDLLDVHMSDFVVVRAFFVKYTSDTHVKIRVDDGLVYVRLLRYVRLLNAWETRYEPQSTACKNSYC